MKEYWVDGFAKWFRHDLSDFDFLWNMTWLLMTDGLWFIVMVIYYLNKYKRRKQR